MRKATIVEQKANAENMTVILGSYVATFMLSTSGVDVLILLTVFYIGLTLLGRVCDAVLPDGLIFQRQPASQASRPLPQSPTTSLLKPIPVERG